MAEAGTYPAIDIEASISRSMLQITQPEQQEQARLLKESFATYRANQDLISVGAYRMGADPNIDRAINTQGPIKEFISQPLTERVGFNEALTTLSRVANEALVTQVVEPAGQGMNATAANYPKRGDLAHASRST